MSTEIISKLQECSRSAKELVTIDLNGSILEVQRGFYGPPDAQQITLAVRMQGTVGMMLGELTNTFSTFSDPPLDLPDWLQTATNSVTLTSLSAAFETSQNGLPSSITALSFGIEVATNWELMKTPSLAISKLKAGFSLAFAENRPSQIQILVGGELTFAGAKIAITARSVICRPLPAWNLATALQEAGFLNQSDSPIDAEIFNNLQATKPPEKTKFDFEIEGRLLESCKLGAVMDQFNWQLDAEALSKATIQQLQMRASTATKSFEFLLDIADCVWSFGDKKISLKDLYLDISGSADGDFAGTLGCSVELSETVTVELEASYDSQKRCWGFEGEIGIESGSELAELIHRNFGIILPDFVHALQPRTGQALLVDLGFNTSTTSSEFHLSVYGQFQIGNKPAATSLEIFYDGKVFSVDGALDLGDPANSQFMHFGLKYESSNGIHTLTGEYTSNPNATNQQAVGSLIKSIGNDLTLPDSLSNLIPTSATLRLSVQRLSVQQEITSLSLSLELSAVKSTLLVRKDTKGTTVAFGLAANKISTKDVLAGSAIGSALNGYSIELDDLKIAVANADGPEGMTLFETPFSKGLLLTGTLKFEGTTFNYPFQCKLGGGPEKVDSENDKPTAVTANTTPSVTTPSPATSDPTKPDNNVKVGRKIGPVTFRKVRFESRDADDGKRIYLLIDASLSAGGFDLDLDGFNIGVPLAALSDPKKLTALTIGLEGLSVAYSNPPLTIAGSFSVVANPPAPYVDHLYQGSLLIKAEAFQISVVGSYGTILVNKEKAASLFLYGVYNGVIGGPAAFFVTGLALGGGYNTKLELPDIENVADYALVKAAMGDDKITSEQVRNAVKPSYGDYWLALGVRFTSFKMADSFALFTVAFGNRLQFALLGLTRLTIPAPVTSGPAKPTILFAELQIKAVLDPDAGIFSFEGRLTKNSYIFTKEIQLVGGFAFFVWFGKSEHAGDFVISLGGYHPDFKPPSHYPLVPRIGIEGKISDALTVSGHAYLTLTPSCIMTGVKLAAVFESDSVTAAFVAYANFIVAWAPFHYDAQVGIGISVVIRTLNSFKLEISADLHIWGPPFSGTARVSYWLVSFSVEFGDQSGSKPKPLEWGEFHPAFLPQRADRNGSPQLATIRIAEGLLREVTKDGVTYRVVNPHDLRIETDSSIPCSEVTAVGLTSADKPRTNTLGIRPMGATKLDSVHSVSITGTSSANNFKYTLSKKKFPEALWSPNEATKNPSELGPGMIEDVPSGVVIRVNVAAPCEGQKLGPFAIEKFRYEPISKTIPWRNITAPDPSTTKFSTIQGNPAIANLVASLPGPSTRWNAINLKNTSKNVATVFQAQPTCAELGQSLGK